MFEEAKLLYLPSVDSTNLWAKEHLDQLSPIGAVWTTSQTQGRGRLGRTWVYAAGRALYYTVAYTPPLAQPAALSLFASLAVAQAIQEKFKAELSSKWPNDLLLNGKKVVGILCEGVPGAALCGIGVNLAQPQRYFEEAGLPYGTSLALEGCTVNTESAPNRLAMRLNRRLTGESFELFAKEGIAPFLEEYRARCVNLGRKVRFEGGEGIAETIDDQGRLVVRTADGEARVFTGEVSVQGVYGAED